VPYSIDNRIWKIEQDAIDLGYMFIGGHQVVGKVVVNLMAVGDGRVSRVEWKVERQDRW
jgi:hypothetical protein